MIILLDTSTPICRLTVVDENSHTEHEWRADRQLARGILAYLRDKVGDFHEITGIGVMKGPGSFTGLRIGITVLNTLADDLDIPIIGETGDSWRETALSRLRNGEDDRIVMPDYGSEAHITTPRK